MTCRIITALVAVLFAAALSVRAEVGPQRLLLYRGVIALAEGNAAEATAFLEQAAELNREEWRPQILYGQALLLAKQYPQAKAELRRAMLLAPTRPEPWQAIIDAGRTMGDRHLEYAGMAGLLRLFPDNPLLLQRMAALNRGMGNPEAAQKLEDAWKAYLPPLKLDYQYLYLMRPATLEELRQITRDEPTNPAALAALATYDWNAGRVEEARKGLKRVYELTPTDPSAVSNYAHLCLLAGQNAEGVRVLSEASAAGLTDQDYLLAIWSMALGNLREAVPLLQRLVAANDIDADLNRLLGTAALLTGDAETAVPALRIAWLTRHDHRTAQLYISALREHREYGLAEEIAQSAIKQFPEETLLSVELSLIYRDTNRLLQAAELCTSLAKTRPEVAELNLLAGERYLRAGYLQRTYETAVLLRDKCASDPVAMDAAITLFQRLGQSADARLVLTRYLGPAIRSPLTRTEIMLALARYAASDNRLPEAKMAIDEIMRLDPVCRDAYVLRGKLFMQQGQWTEAMRTYTAALARWPDDNELTLALARAALQAGNYPQAMKSYRQAMKLFNTAGPALELGEIYESMGDDTRAREVWTAAIQTPGGQVRARIKLFASHEKAGEFDSAEKMLAEVETALTAERTACEKRWRTVLAAQGLPPTAEEMEALLLLDDALVDPAMISIRREALLAAKRAAEAKLHETLTAPDEKTPEQPQPPAEAPPAEKPAPTEAAPAAQPAPPAEAPKNAG